jgi:hypothetical protein
MGRNSKRPLDRDSSKVSPPSKMAGGLGGSGASRGENSEVLAKLTSIEAKFDSLESRFTNLEVEVAEISRVLKEIESVKGEVDNLRSEVDILKVSLNGFQRMEIEAKRRSILIKGLRFESGDKRFETRTQTKAALSKFFEKVDLTPHLVDYYRLGGRRDDEDGSRVCVRVQFDDVDQKFELFEKLKSSGRTLSDYSILTDYPSFQQQEFKALSGKAYELRTATPGLKTRIVPKGLGLQLQTRAGSEHKWTAVSQ